jgi:hypothetical protein
MNISNLAHNWRVQEPKEIAKWPNAQQQSTVQYNGADPDGVGPASTKLVETTRALHVVTNTHSNLTTFAFSDKTLRIAQKCSDCAEIQSSVVFTIPPYQHHCLYWKWAQVDRGACCHSRGTAGSASGGTKCCHFERRVGFMKVSRIYEGVGWHWAKLGPPSGRGQSVACLVAVHIEDTR